ncbi:MAG: molybdopterin-dependent oxidoreductase [Armatimonadota bacterium]|nr:molybdopterin-dependent oxidoreductase [Armatimonadota bacterium]
MSEEQKDQVERVEQSPVEDAERRMRQISRRSFLWAGVASLGAFTGWKWLDSRRLEDGQPWPFRRVLEVNRDLSEDYFRPGRLSPQFPLSAASSVKVNGDYGVTANFNIAEWKLQVLGLASQSQTGDAEPLLLTMKDIKKLPHHEMTTELKCIEGWSKIIHWGGARFSDFAAMVKPAEGGDGGPMPYVSLETPDGGYYVGLDMASAMHPQTLLCYEMNGRPLTVEHGAPLRLVIPVKYGIKNIKRIGTIRFTDKRPADYWAEQGYDWYSGH